MADIATTPVWQALDGNGNPLPGAKATFFLSGTTTPQTVYSDAALTVPHPSPLLADASGRFPPVYVGAVQIKVVVTTSAGAAVYTVDPVPKSTAGGTGAAQVSFAPTASIPALTVQAAIEQVQTNLDGSSSAFVKTLLDDTTAGAFMTTLGISAYMQTLMPAANVSSAQTTLGISAYMQTLVPAANALAARTTLGAHPLAQSGAGVGQIQGIFGAAGSTINLPAGGTWAYYWQGESTTTGVSALQGVGVAAGGSAVGGPSAGLQLLGWAWRIA